MASSSTAAGIATSEFSIFERLLTNGGKFSPALARHLLRLEFSTDDRERMNDLAIRNQQGELTAEEFAELQSYVKVGHLLATLQFKARRSNHP